MIEFHCIMIFIHISVIQHNQRTTASQKPPNVSSLSKSNQPVSKATTGKNEKRRRSELDEDSDLEELLENDNITLEGN